MMKSKTKNSAGFTLIELLITMTIIAILATVGIVFYSKFIANARDAKRQSDLKFIQSGLEQYFADQHYYPPTMPASGGPLQSPDGTKTYLSSIPADPLPTNPNYFYSASGSGCGVSSPQSCNSYCMWAKTETTSAAIASCPPPNPDYNFAVTVP